MNTKGRCATAGGGSTARCSMLMCSTWARGEHGPVLGSDPFRSSSPKKAAPLAFWHVITPKGVKVATAQPDAGNRRLCRQNHAPRGYLKAIRAHCLWCCVEQAHEVRLCQDTSCPLFPFRFGRRPRLSEVRVDPAAE